QVVCRDVSPGFAVEMAEYRMQWLVFVPFLAVQYAHVAAGTSHIFGHDIHQQRLADARPAPYQHAAWGLGPWQARPHSNQHVEFAHAAEHPADRSQVTYRVEHVLRLAVAIFVVHGELGDDAIACSGGEQDLTGFGQIRQAHGVVAQQRHDLARLGVAHHQYVGVHAQPDANALGKLQAAQLTGQAGTQVGRLFDYGGKAEQHQQAAVDARLDVTAQCFGPGAYAFDRGAQ